MPGKPDTLPPLTEEQQNHIHLEISSWEIPQLTDAFQYQRLVQGLAEFVCWEKGVIDYSSPAARRKLGKIDKDLNNLGFRRSEVKILAAAALDELDGFRNHLNFVEDPGDMYVKAA